MVTRFGQVSEAWARRHPLSHFAQAGVVLQGRLTALDLPRLAREEGVELVSDVEARVQALDRRGEVEQTRSGFTVAVKASLRLTCQSCAASFLHEAVSVSTLWVACDEAELLRWEREAVAGDFEEPASAEEVVHSAADFEVLLAHEEASARDLVEDELLLALPTVPRCRDCSAAPAPRRYSFSSV
ncbi:MAG: DUF177 domain-containing protein [Casimicrobiaceae bacterium]|nr:DUF177 domain-containing protein [Casimicrobiaceae bacterium]MCX8099501.1 DUF177 domain-containing protein [Casimicrobiaceae bacterium]MDW8312822.1 hypothetical protein [Burkholderiales bacterium]